MSRWSQQRCPTRSHSELDRETLSRLWYFVLRHGKVGRRRLFYLLFPFCSILFLSSFLTPFIIVYYKKSSPQGRFFCWLRFEAFASLVITAEVFHFDPTPHSTVKPNRPIILCLARRESLLVAGSGCLLSPYRSILFLSSSFHYCILQKNSL